MKHLKVLVLLICTFVINEAHADYNGNLVPDTQSSNKLEFAVEQVSRICPTWMWDSWSFRDIGYIEEDNTVVWVIQLSNRMKKKDEATQEDINKLTARIIENIMEGYESLIKYPNADPEGDFMLYLGLGNLLNRIQENGASLRILLMNPIRECLTFGDKPMSLDASQLKAILEKEDYEVSVSTVDEEYNFVMVEKSPEFPGGEDAMQKWIRSNLRYPSQAKKAHVEGTVNVEVTFEKDGKISNAEIVKSVDPSLDEEALRLIDEMPQWEPGNVNGLKVRSKRIIPIKFQLKK